MRATNGTATKRRHKAVLRKAEGSWGTRHASYRIAKQTIIRAGEYAYRDRKNKKRDFRKLWIARINAAVRELGFTYSKFMNKLSQLNIEINRKMLSELAINDQEVFANFVKEVMSK
ncbi:MAG: 50S ribosomal protein L20 [Ureaplasma sp.]|nr:50S ribosomal protein L20 [Ureaplasma sp.]